MGINLDRLQEFINSKNIKDVINKEILVQHGLANKKDLIKILGRGELTSKIDITVDAFSASAKLAIEKSGGQAKIINE